MGRFPFITETKRYLVDIRHYYQPTTWNEIDRKLRHLARVFDDLRARGLVATTNPRKISESDVAAFLGYMKERRLDVATQHKYVSYLQALLEWAGNPIVRLMRLRKRFRIVVPPKPLHPIAEDRLARIRAAADAVDGWPGDVMRFVIGVVPFCGLRPGEFRRLRLVDLDTVRWQFVVSSPKGVDKWAPGGDDGERAPILPPGRQPTLDFLAARDAYLRSRGLDPARVEPLIPYVSPRTKLVHVWNESVLSRLKCRAIEDVVGFRFQLRDLRPTFAQANKDRGVGIEAVSKALRHRTTRTTELYYTRIRNDAAFAELERAWL